MRKHPYRIWWFGSVLFFPSVLLWVLSIAIFTGASMWDPPGGLYGFLRIWLPMIAALIGFTAPILFMCLCGERSVRFHVIGFAVYLLGILTWAVTDIGYGHYQQRTNVLGSGCKHLYITWYFVPPPLVAGLSESFVPTKPVEPTGNSSLP